MSRYKSYYILEAFKDELMKQGFDHVPVNYTEDDIRPFKLSFDKRLNDFKYSIRGDLREAFSSDLSVSLTGNGFYINDTGVHEASYINLKATLSRNSSKVKILVKYLILKDVIYITSDNKTACKDPDTIMDLKLNQFYGYLNSAHKTPWHFQPVELKDLKIF